MKNLLKKICGLTSVILLLQILSYTADNSKKKPNNLWTIPELIEALKNKDAKIRHSAITCLGVKQDSIVIPVLIEALKDEDSLVRQQAVNYLKSKKDNRVIPALLDALKSDDPIVKKNIIFAFGSKLDDRIISVLIDVLKNDKNPVVKDAVISVFFNRTDNRIITALLDALKDENAGIRQLAVNNLGRVKDERVIPALIEVLNDEDPNVRINAVYSLANMKDERVIPAIIGALEDGESGVRDAAAFTLSGRKEKAAYIALLGTQCDESMLVMLKKQYGIITKKNIIEFLKDKDKNVRIAAVFALIGNKENTPAVVEQLMRMLQKDASVDVKAMALKGIAALEKQDNKAIAVLKSFVKDKNNKIRAAAMQGLFMRGVQDAAAEFIEALADSDENVKIYALKGIGKLSEFLDRKALINIYTNALKDKNKKVREAAIYECSFFKDLTGTELLWKELLKDDDNKVRSFALGSLITIPTKESTGIIAEALKDKDKGIKLKAIAELLNRKDQGTLEVLKEAILDEDIKEKSVEGLYLFGTAKALPELVRLLKEDKNSRIMLYAVKGVGRLGKAEEIEILLQKIDDENNEVRLWIIKAIGAIYNSLNKEKKEEVKNKIKEALLIQSEKETLSEIRKEIKQFIDIL